MSSEVVAIDANRPGRNGVTPQLHNHHLMLMSLVEQLLPSTQDHICFQWPAVLVLGVLLLLPPTMNSSILSSQSAYLDSLN